MASPARPGDRRFTREHEWVTLEDDQVALVGITDYAAHELGDVVYVQLPDPGTAVKQFEKLGEIESVKAVSDLFSPVSGEIVETNAGVVATPELVNESPMNDGWMLRMRLADPAELDRLMDQAQYEAYLADLERQALEGE